MKQLTNFTQGMKQGDKILVPVTADVEQVVEAEVDSIINEFEVGARINKGKSQESVIPIPKSMVVEVGGRKRKPVRVDLGTYQILTPDYKTNHGEFGVLKKWMVEMHEKGAQYIQGGAKVDYYDAGGDVDGIWFTAFKMDDETNVQFYHRLKEADEKQETKDKKAKESRRKQYLKLKKEFENE